ncbi:MAG: trehalose-phosphatase [Planctomycetota bacterium]|nr:MAG: trehalose-phosphatase [Planctomycetota bacterium]
MVVTEDPRISESLERLARAPILLVATDYDGTLAPIVPDPASAAPHRETIVALRALASMPQTHAAIISGRALAELASLSGAPDEIHLVGSHGSEFDADFTRSLTPEQEAVRDRVLGALEEIARAGDGFLVERKPASVAFHFRNADESDARRALKEIREGPASIPGVYLKDGKKVIELCVVETNKGRALETLRRRLGASAALFIGDDITDEDAFATLTGPDVGVKVGPGETRAALRVDDPEAVARLLARLAELRADWLAGAEAVPIEEHALLSDLRSAALVTPTGRVVWMCLPRIDSPALFAEILGGPSAGRFAVADPAGAEPTDQRYDDHSVTLITAWPGFRVVDYLDCSGGRWRQRAGRSDLVRVIEATGRAPARVRIEFAPRLDFGRVHTRLVRRDDGLEIADTHDPAVLRAPGVAWEILDEGPHHTAVADVEVAPGAPVTLEFRYGTGNLRPSVAPEPKRREETERLFGDWARSLDLPGNYADLVRRSALTIKALTHGPTGAILAAATTSLPEHVGGVRNWDYRYCWLRDAAMGAASLVSLGSTAEALSLLDWILGVLDETPSPERLQPLYTVTGHHLGPEGEIGELPGYCGSRPVRVGNAASRQVQLDVFGPIVELVHRLLAVGAPLSAEHWRLVEAMVSAVERRWREPDHGIWEIRAAPRLHVHSKTMCWVTVDRAIAIADQFLQRQRDGWRALRDEIAEDVLTHGYKASVGAFTAAYDGEDLDAAALEVGLRGLVPADDPRFIGTVEAIERELRFGPTVYRYRSDDGLPGYEGGFNLCTTWLILAYQKIGRDADARTLFRAYCELAGRTGLIPEEYGPRSRRALGNHPQVYSHLGLIDCAIALNHSA